MIDTSRTPQEVKDSLERYVHQRIPTGGFLEAVLSNDLYGAVARVDHINIELLPEIVAYVVNELPASCWGSRKAVKEWLTHS